MLEDPSASYDFLASFTDWHQEPEDPDYPARVFDYWFSRGFLLKGPDFMLLGGEHPMRDLPDTWYVAWAELAPPSTDIMHGIRLFVRLMPHYRPYIIWQRAARGRSERRFSTDRLLALTKK